MSLLLDTHGFILFVDEPDRLPGRTRAALENSVTELFLGVASPSEMWIKVALRKLQLAAAPRDMVRYRTEQP